MKFLEKLKKIVCVLIGHNWVSEFDPQSEIKKPFHKRVYCKRCGYYYHSAKYQQNKN